jgi:hypothetical protein
MYIVLLLLMNGINKCFWRWLPKLNIQDQLMQLPLITVTFWFDCQTSLCPACVFDCLSPLWPVGLLAKCPEGSTDSRHCVFDCLLHCGLWVGLPLINVTCGLDCLSPL